MSDCEQVWCSAVLPRNLWGCFTLEASRWLIYSLGKHSQMETQGLLLAAWVFMRWGRWGFCGAGNTRPWTRTSAADSHMDSIGPAPEMCAVMCQGTFTPASSPTPRCLGAASLRPSSTSTAAFKREAHCNCEGKSPSRAESLEAICFFTQGLFLCQKALIPPDSIARRLA